MIAKFTHANTKQEVHIALPLVFSSYYSEATKCTHVLATGGAIIPISESPELVMGFVKIYHEGVKNEVQGKTKRAK